jgi:hypothetical protein
MYQPYYALRKSSPIDIQINTKMEMALPNKVSLIDYMAWTFHFDIDLDIDWRTFSQGVIESLHKKKLLTKKMLLWMFIILIYLLLLSYFPYLSQEKK